MAETEEPNTTFVVGDKTYELAQLEDLTFKEARLLKAYTPLTGPDLGLALSKMDPDAWIGVLVISMARTRGRSPVETLEAELEEINFLDAISSSEDDEEEVGDDVPPSESTASSDVGDAPPQSETPDADGPPPSPPDSV